MRTNRRARMSLATLWVLTILMAIFIVAFLGFAAVSTASAALPGKNGDLLLNIQPDPDSHLSETATVRGDGSSLRPLNPAAGALGGNAVFAPDGASIAAAFETHAGSESGIFSLALGKNTPKRIWDVPDPLFPGGDLAYPPSSGPLLLTYFWSDCSDRDCRNIYVDPANGIYSHNLKTGVDDRVEFDAPRVNPKASTYFPDGTRIAVVSVDDPEASLNPSGYAIYTASPDGHRTRRIFETGKKIWDISVSPDGRRIAFTVAKFTTARYLTDIYSIRADGSGLHRITHDTVSSGPVFSPDGTRIGMSKLDGTRGFPLPETDVWTAATDGSSARLLLERKGNDELLDWGRAEPFRIVEYKRSKSLLAVRTWGPGAVTVAGPVFARHRQMATEAGIVRVPVDIKRGYRLQAGAKFKLNVKFAPKGALPSTLTKYIKLG